MRSVPTIKVVYEPTKSVVPIYSPEAIEEQKRKRARQQEMRNRDAAEREARRNMSELQATRQAVVDAISDQSTRH